MVQDRAWQPGDPSGEQVLDGRVGGPRDRHGAAVAAHAGEPEDVDLLERAVDASPEAPDPIGSVLAEDVARVLHRLQPELLLHRPTPPWTQTVCLVHLLCGS